jgi:hypothetical protein
VPKRSQEPKLKSENEELKRQISDQEDLIKDMETTVAVTAACALGGKNQEVHIKFNQK